MANETAGQAAPGWNVLVVDDEENLNWSLVTSLRRDNYIADGALSGEEALRRLAQRRYDFVISDVKMPGMDGFELLEYLRHQHPTTRVIMMTAFGSPTARQEAFRGGVVAFLEKPFDLRVLKSELRRLANMAHGQAAAAYDVLDVAQVINLTRRDVTLLISNSDLRGELRFDHGELLWAGAGALRGEEAFYQLTVPRALSIEPRPRSSSSERNVAQPLSRLLFQALAARSRAANSRADSSPPPEAPTRSAEPSETYPPQWNAQTPPPTPWAPADTGLTPPTGQGVPVGTPTPWSASATWTSAAQPTDASVAPHAANQARATDEAEWPTASMVAVGVASAGQAPRPAEEGSQNARLTTILERIVVAVGGPCGVVVVSADGTVLGRADGGFAAAVDSVYAHFTAAAQSAARALLLANWGTLREARLETSRATVVASRLGPGEGASLCILAIPHTTDAGEPKPTTDDPSAAVRRFLPEVLTALR